MLKFTGERIVPGADNCEKLFARKMYQEHIARYLFASQFVAGRDVLDVGCGVGYGSNWLAQQGARRIYALDLSADAIAFAREHYGHPAIEFTRDNAEIFEVQQQFDVAVCFELIEHVQVQSQVIANIRKHLKKDGLLVISTPRPLGPQMRSAFHTHELPFADFKALLSIHFPHLQFFYENNLFISNVGQQQPLEQNILKLALEEADLFNVQRCDYFLCLASNHPLENVKGSVSVNDEQYIKNLERDVGILHRAEDDLRAQLNQTAAALHSKEELVSVQHHLIQVREADLRDSKALNYHYHTQLTQIASSRAWKLLTTLRQAGSLLLPVGSPQRRAMRLAFNAARKVRKPRELARAVWRRCDRILHRMPGIHSEAQVGNPALLAKRRRDGRLSKVTFLIGCEPGESKRYRVFNVMEALARRGIQTAAIRESDVGALQPYLDSDLLIVFRAGMNANLARILRCFREASVPTIYDVDDLIFEPESIHHVDALRSFNAAQVEEYKYGVALARAALLACDAATCTTEFLRQRIEKLGKKARVIANTLNLAQIERAKQYSDKQRHPSSMVSIGYFSGTYTHNQDFLEAAAALEEVLAENPNVVLHLVGELDVPPSFRRFGERIIVRPSMSYLDMLDYLATMDINIAPLELNNPYTASKSELKIFEAALAGVPSVVSAVDSYARLIDHGINGFLAHNGEDWKNHLTALVQDAGLRRRVSEASRRDFVPRFHIENNVDHILAVYEELRREKPAEIKTDLACLDIGWVVPAPTPGSGGHRNIYRAIRNLARFGHKLTVYHIGWSDREDVKSFVQRHFFDLPGVQFVPESATVGPHDVCLATHWSTVYPMLRSRDVIRYPFYFVQDFEPFFYCMGSDYLRAERTYKMGLTHITSGPWPTAILRKRYGADADYFLFPVQRSVYHPGPRVKLKKNIVFFARPEMPRRCFELGLEMLARLHQRNPDVEIILFGSRNIDSTRVPFPHANLGLLPSVEDLATLYRNADLGIVFSTTNPSLVPYEMMACGLAVCDLDLEAAATNYGGEDNVFLLDLDPETMADQLLNILANEDERQRRARNGYAFVEHFPDEEGCGRRIEELIVRRIVAGKLCPDSSAISDARAA